VEEISDAELLVAGVKVMDQEVMRPQGLRSVSFYVYELNPWDFIIRLTLVQVWSRVGDCVFLTGSQVIP
jgi:hypothetical protein